MDAMNGNVAHFVTFNQSPLVFETDGSNFKHCAHLIVHLRLRHSESEMVEFKVKFFLGLVAHRQRQNSNIQFLLFANGNCHKILCYAIDEKETVGN